MSSSDFISPLLPTVNLQTGNVHHHLDIDEGGKVELVSRPLAHEELVSLLLRQSVQELRERDGREIS